MPPLLAVLLDRIRTDGPLTVAEFVEAALYHDELGYYARSGQRSGRLGDFFTSVDVGPVFGELLAVQFAEMWRILSMGAAAGATPGFDLVEAAAGNGRLARDVLDHAERSDPDFYRAIRLHLVERSRQARAGQPSVLGRHAPALASAGGELPAGVTGVIYANELLDALPPHLVVMRDGGLQEVYVDAEAGRLVTRDGPLSSPRIAAYLEAGSARLEPGWTVEVNLAAADWVRDAAARLARGFLVVVDYGHDAETLYSASHAAGTLTTYRRHASEARADGPLWLQEPGECDITSHVDLSGVTRAARDAGLQPLGTVDQTYFLAALGFGDEPGALREEAAGFRRRLALKTLLVPGGLGSTHKVMVFAKSVDAPALRGLSFGGRVT